MEPIEQTPQEILNQESFSFSKEAIQHMKKPHHFGEPERFVGHGCITGPCGDTMNFWIRVLNSRLFEVYFTTDGCVSSVASGSMCASLAEGMDVSEAKTITQSRILEALGGMPKAEEHCALLASNTLMAAVRDYFIRRPQQSWMRAYR